MPAYLIGKMEIRDHDAYARYKAVTPEIIKRHGGRFLTRGGEKITLEGKEETRRIVIVEFDSPHTAEAFYRSPEYQQAMKLREGAALMDLMIVGGFE
ncbi:DUF1330 domain-containing protein [Noviherbaspirillum sp. CPCC 100848]|uniref:DUF1330 domain-containing protein n=1 Tax=Noviherbaspirillum album TaxID=3080276 RepID=A0ABU6JGD0_9BURK|nr:DUF1330 domain-containing protein [Noviherbaspirillum sp. CPCC 100848]MEC4722580.1 DUF1330 domain-containing protein [Noviherbaspirillum sp. CPCC 100848]